MTTTKYSKTILASYATFKELYSSNKYESVYQILSEFIIYIVSEKELYSFTVTEIQGKLKEEFGFEPPKAVIRTAIKQIKGISCPNGSFKVDRGILKGGKDFADIKRRTDIDNDKVLGRLSEFAINRIDGLDTARLQQEFICFLLDEEGNPEYRKVIGEFILENQNSDEIQRILSEAQEGSILYSGITYNISEYGSITKELTIYLDTEIIFDIYGLNGSIYKTLAEEFLNLVAQANKNRKVITLKFFRDVKDDLDKYYERAEQIVSEKGGVAIRNAMRQIVTGCRDSSDVKEKLVDLYVDLRKNHNITVDDKTNFNAAELEQYEVGKTDIDCNDNEDLSDEEGYRFCSYINKLRKGQTYEDYFCSRYICVSDTKRVLEVSSLLIDGLANPSPSGRFCDYAISLSRITNLLWFKLECGFGSQKKGSFPRNLSAVIKARIILSGYITQGISEKYKEIKEKVKSGKLTTEQAAERITVLRTKKSLPEELTAGNLNDNLRFDNEYFDRAAEEIEGNKQLLNEKDIVIKNLNNEVDELQFELSRKDIEEQRKDEKIRKLEEQIKINQDEKTLKEKNIKRIKNVIGLILNVLWKIIVLGLIVFLTYRISSWLGCSVSEVASIVIGIIGLIPIVWSILKKDITKFKAKNKELCLSEPDGKESSD